MWRSETRSTPRFSGPGIDARAMSDATIVATLARRLQARLAGRPIRTEPSLRGMRTARSVCYSCVTTIWPEAQESFGDERIQRCLTRRAFNAAEALRLRNRQPETRHLKVFRPDPCQQRDWHTNLSVRAPILLEPSRRGPRCTSGLYGGELVGSLVIQC